jgi:hypothetical protein
MPLDTHEWVSFEDPDEYRTWVFDVTFLTSPWTCIFGTGCLGVLTGPAPELAQGCCSYGAHFTDREDVVHIETVAATLTPDEWQFADRARRRRNGRLAISEKNADGETVSLLVDDACIFLNRPDFHAGAGCALHLAALGRGKRPHELKPNVCWQLPLRREDEEQGEEGRVVSTIRQWDRSHWGEGGEEFHWWCTESPEAFVGSVPVYVSMRDELIALTNRRVYNMLMGYLDRRDGAPVPHPVLRRRKPARAQTQ